MADINPPPRENESSPKREEQMRNALERRRNQRTFGRPGGDLGPAAGAGMAATGAAIGAGVKGTQRAGQRGLQAARAGAASGSVIPVVGTALGAGAGFLAGAGLGAAEGVTEGAWQGARRGHRLARGAPQQDLWARALKRGVGAGAKIAKNAAMSGLAAGVGFLAIWVVLLLLLILPFWYLSTLTA